MNINKRIKELRNQLNLSQEEFGKRISLVKSGVSNFESGARTVTDKNIKLICKEFNVNEEWLVNGIGEMFNQTKLSLMELLGEKINSLSEIEKKALYEFIKLPIEQRTIIMDFIKKIK